MMKHQSIPSKALAIDKVFNSLDLEEQCAIALEQHLGGFAAGLGAARSRFHAETARVAERLHAVQSALKNSEQLDLELAAAGRNAEAGIIEIEENAWLQIDQALDAGEAIGNAESLERELARLTARIHEAGDDQERARHLLEKAGHPKWPAVSPQAFWTTTLMASALILVTDFLFARFVSLSQTELLLVLACDLATVLALTLAPKGRNYVPAPKYSIAPGPSDYATQPVPVS